MFLCVFKDRCIKCSSKMLQVVLLGGFSTICLAWMHLTVRAKSLYNEYYSRSQAAKESGISNEQLKQGTWFFRGKKGMKNYPVLYGVNKPWHKDPYETTIFTPFLQRVNSGGVWTSGPRSRVGSHAMSGCRAAWVFRYWQILPSLKLTKTPLKIGWNPKGK